MRRQTYSEKSIRSLIPDREAGLHINESNQSVQIVGRLPDSEPVRRNVEWLLTSKTAVGWHVDVIDVTGRQVPSAFMG